MMKMNNNNQDIQEIAIKANTILERKYTPEGDFFLERQTDRAWIKTLEEIINVMIHSNKISQETNESLPFAEFFVEIIALAKSKLNKLIVPNYSYLSESAFRQLERSLLKLLVQLYQETLEFEFQSYRLFYLMNDDVTSFQIDESHEKESYERQLYFNFLKEMKSKIVSFYKEYPILAKLTALSIEKWVDNQSEFLQRLGVDQINLNRCFATNGQLGQVKSVEAFYSNRHHLGRPIFILTFDGGEKVVYKQKNLKIDQNFYNLLTWLNKKGYQTPFKTVKILDRITYGWVEYVHHQPCTKKDEIHRYYQRAGAYLCLVYALNGTDCHRGNLIASGEFPVLIDLETLFIPRINKQQDWEGYYTPSMANKCFLDSVLSTAFLPLWFKYKRKEINIGGLCKESDGTELGRHKNIPFIDGKTHDVYTFIDDLMNGFTQMYHFIIDHKAELLDECGPLTVFRSNTVRYIFRNTRLYFQLFCEALLPNHLHSGVEFSKQLDKLYRVMREKKTQQKFWPIIAKEIEALLKMDLPYFQVDINSDALKLSENEQVEHFFVESGYQRAVNKINRMDKIDLEKQLDYIKDSLGDSTKIFIN